MPLQKKLQTMNDNKINDLLNNLYNGCATLLGSLLNDDEQQYDRIIFMGSHGTGKSTLAKELSDIIGIPVVESVAREVTKDINYLKDKKVITNPDSDAYQTVLCSVSRWDFMRWVDSRFPVIMTRCPLDTIAYAMADDDVSEGTVKMNMSILQDDEGFNAAIKNSLFIYIPIEFGIEDDGIRPTDIQFQKDVDECMRRLMHTFHITPLVVTGTVEERLEAILVKLVGADMAKVLLDGAYE